MDLSAEEVITNARHRPRNLPPLHLRAGAPHTDAALTHAAAIMAATTDAHASAAADYWEQAAWLFRSLLDGDRHLAHRFRGSR
ncbi:hypothetical protein C3B44_10525 [Corynebacterium yudongzhengii]|uniref:Uncharacterized protein n=2 Tax=Corynebacterium yudongzhengii TaxID=2080740 RepID=A0A2U1T4R0_9CORY|nr:hypothetical protein C3B44_10525 [Corynebacterium yudongzhengii]PWC00955.1 hypothetical protein DF222_10045 [Corynebacterium yudongzhengii]